MNRVRKAKLTKLLALVLALVVLSILGFWGAQKFLLSDESTVSDSDISKTGVCSGDTAINDIVSSALNPERTSDDGSLDRLVADIKSNSESSKDINCVYILVLHSALTGDYAKGKEYLLLFRELEKSSGANPYRPAKNYISVTELEKLLNIPPPERLGQ